MRRQRFSVSFPVDHPTPGEARRDILSIAGACAELRAVIRKLFTFVSERLDYTGEN